MSTEFDTIKDNHFIISDTHFYHDNIVKYCQRPGFDGRYENHDFSLHNEIMEKNWRKTIQEDDVVLHLGDLMFFGRNEEIRKRAKDLVSSLPGRKFLVLGNHDDSKSRTYQDLGFTVIPPFSTEYEDWGIHFDHYPLYQPAPKQISVHGHVHNNTTENLGKRHLNVCVELRSFSPQPLKHMLNEALFTAKKQDFSRDFGNVRKRNKV